MNEKETRIMTAEFREKLYNLLKDSKPNANYSYSEQGVFMESELSDVEFGVRMAIVQCHEACKRMLLSKKDVHDIWDVTEAIVEHRRVFMARYGNVEAERKETESE